MKTSYLLIPLIVSVAFGLGYALYYIPNSKQLEVARIEAAQEAEAARVKRVEEERAAQRAAALKQLEEFETRRKAREARIKARQEAEQAASDDLARAKSARDSVRSQITNVKSGTASEEKLMADLTTEREAVDFEKAFLQEYAGKISNSANQLAGMIERLSRIERERAAAAQAATQAAN